ncbi:MAG: hypothetical protein AAGA28_13655 [Pseudomonadota bacterium]
MTRLSLAFCSTLIAGLAVSGAAAAGCVADFKAKSDNPLNLVYETVQITGPCTLANATAQLEKALAARGLTLLKVVAVREQ